MDRVYFDTCCFGRLDDDQQNFRITQETTAVLEIIRLIETRKLLLIASFANYVEVSNTSDPARRTHVKELLTLASIYIGQTAQSDNRALYLRSKGIQGIDSIHASCAEAAEANTLLTTDDKFIARMKRVGSLYTIPVLNPVVWLQEKKVR